MTTSPSNDMWNEVLADLGLDPERAAADTFCSPFLAKVLSFAHWTSTPRGRGASMDVWVDKFCHHTFTVASCRYGAMLLPGPLGCDSFAVSSTSLDALIRYLGHRDRHVYFRRCGPDYDLYDGATAHTWLASKRTDFHFDAYLSHPQYEKAYEFALSDITAVATALKKFGPEQLVDVVLHPWGDATIMAGVTTVECRSHPKSCGDDSFFIRLPLGSLFGLFFSAFRGSRAQVPVALRVHLDRDDSAMLSVTRRLGINEDGSLSRSANPHYGADVVYVTRAAAIPGGSLLRKLPRPTKEPDPLFLIAMGADDE